MKKLALLIMSLTCVLLLSSCNKMIFESNGDGTCSLKSSIGFSEKEIVIPSESPKGDTVTEISSKAFRYCKGFTSVTIPDSVTSIGEYAFYDCRGLTSVHITDLAKWCGISFASNSSNPLCYAENLYLNGNLVTELRIPAGVSSIGDYAFWDCSGLTSVTIPDSVLSIGDDAFYNCSGLTSIHITDLAKWCGISFDSYISNPLYYAKNLYLNGNLVTELTIPDGVSSIGNYAFSGCRGLTSVTIPDSVLSIGNYAFRDCTGLTSITIPDSVLSIGARAFEGCFSLTSVTIGNSVTSISDWAFSDCSGLISVTIGNSVTSIGGGAFYNCRGLKSITIPDSVTSIGNYAFRGCRGLASVTIGNSVTSIGDYAFWDCRGLTTVYYAGTEAEWSKISINSYNSELTSATRYYYSETEPTAAGNYWHYDKNGNLAVW